jgi:hypothetical protein
VKPIGRQPSTESPHGAFAAVYVARTAMPDAIRSAVATLSLPASVTSVAVDDSMITDTFDCRVVVYLSGEFDAAAGVAMARDYAAKLSGALGSPAYSLNDLLRIERDAD